MYLNIDVNKVLRSKAPVKDDNMISVAESFKNAENIQTPANIINFMTSFKNSSKENILENLSSLCDINSDITFSYFSNVLEVAELPDSILNQYKSYINTLLESVDDTDHIDRLNQTIAKIDSVIETNNDIELIRDEMLMKLNVDRIKRSCVFESYLEDDLEVLIYNINTSPETISEYEKIIRKIKMSKTSEYFSSFPMLLVKNTELIRNLRIRVVGDVLELLTSMPLVISKKFTEQKVSPTIIKSYVKILDKQIALLYSDLKQNEPAKYQIYSIYVKNLIDSKRQLCNKYTLTNVKESITSLDNDGVDTVDEHIAEMQPDIISYNECVLEDIIAEMEDSLTKIIFDPGEEINEPELENFTRLCKTLEATSNAQKGAIRAGHKIGAATQKTVNKAKASATDAKRVTLPIKKAIEPVYNAINNTVNKLKEMDKKERTERIITGGFKLKLMNYIKKGIGLIALGGVSMAAAKAVGGAFFGPIVGIIISAIGILSAVAIDRNIDKKHRQNILIDLKNELKMVEEKIEDAKSDNERSKKYELMRIQQKLKKDIERIEYHLE